MKEAWLLKIHEQLNKGTDQSFQQTNDSSPGGLPSSKPPKGVVEILPLDTLGRRGAPTPTSQREGLSFNNNNNFIFLFNYKAQDNANKKITIYYVVWTRLTRVGCINWLAHYKLMRIANKNNVHCTF